MRIVKTGKQRVWQEECKRCYTLYEYTQSDYYEMEEEQPSGLVREEYHLFKKTEKYRQICRYKWQCLKCPVCGDVKKRMDAANLFKPVEVRWEKV